MAGVASGAVPRLPVPSRIGVIGTSRLFAWPVGANGASGQTYLLGTGSDAAFDWVRLVFMNGSSSTYTVGGASVAATAVAPANGWAATNPDGSARAFLPVTFNGGANSAALLPPAPAGSVSTLTVPARLSGAVPSLAFSDWMALPCVPPTDGGSFHHLLARTFVSSGTLAGPYATPASKLNTTFATLIGARRLRGAIATFAAANGNFTAATGAPDTIADGGQVCPAAVQFMGRRRGLTILEVGDGTALGVETPADHHGAALQAVKAVSTPEAPVFLVNAAAAALASSDAFTVATRAIDGFAPSVILVPFYSVSDSGSSQASADTGFGLGLALVEYALAKGIVPILKTPPPNANLNAASDGYRRSVAARVRDLSPAFFVADFDAVLSDGGTPARLKPAFAGAGTAPNEAGQAACADALKPVLHRLLAAIRAA